MRVRFRCDPALIDWLPRPKTARDALPEWLRRMPASAFSESHGHSVRTLKQCPPFIDAMSSGFVLTLPCDVRVADGEFTWAWPLPPLSIREHTRSPLSFHVPAQAIGSPLHDERRSILKFNCFWTIELDKGWSLLATHPFNRLDLPFRTLAGLVDSDRFHDVGIFFPAQWTDPSYEGVLPAGTPVVQCVPVLREGIEMQCLPFSPEEARQYASVGAAIKAEPGYYRKIARAPKRLAREAVAEGLEIEDEDPDVAGWKSLRDDSEC
jgi:hypothetical protein